MGFLEKAKEQAEAKKQEEIAKRKEEAAAFLFESEEIEHFFKNETFGSGDDFTCITSLRLITIDKSFLTSKKAVFSIPFSKINYVSLQKGGFLNFSKEVEFGIHNKSMSLKFFNSEKALAFHKALSEKITPNQTE